MEYTGEYKSFSLKWSFGWDDEVVYMLDSEEKEKLVLPCSLRIWRLYKAMCRDTNH